MPSLIFPWSDQKELTSSYSLGPSSVLSILKVNSGSFSISEESEEKEEPRGTMEDGQRLNNEVKQHRVCRSHSKSHSFKNAMTDGKMELAALLRLSSHQISLLLSSIWVQATFTENTPVNFEAMAHAYNIALLFTRTKTSRHVALIRCFQLAFSLRSMSLGQKVGLQPSRRRSIFTMASCMLIFSARAGNLSELIPIVKSSLTDITVDPYLELVDNIRLQAVLEDSVAGGRTYGSKEDDFAALKSVSAIQSDEQQLKEVVISHLMTKFEKLSKEELSGIKKQLLLKFSPDESYSLGVPIFTETPQPFSPIAELEFETFDEVLATTFPDEALLDAKGSQSGCKTLISSNSLNILNVTQLLESVLETAQQEACLPVSTALVSYDQVKDQCEALVTGKLQKMSVLHNFNQQQEDKAIVLACGSGMKSPTAPDTPVEDSEPSPTGKDLIEHRDQLYPRLSENVHQSFRLPPASPYDKFLRAAGC